MRYSGHTREISEQGGEMDQIDLLVVVNGTPALVHARKGTHLRKVVEEALDETKNIGQPADRWQLRNAEGLLLEQSKTVGHYHLESGVKLFLNLEAGIGG
jgi:hypothetical protein